MTNIANDTETGPGGFSGEQRKGTTAPIREKVGEVLGTAKDRTVTAYSTSRDRAADALESARERAALAARRTAQGIDENPIAALVGGLALGAIAGVLLPSTRKEAEMLRPLGSRIGEATRVASQAAREAGQAKLDELGLTRDSAREQVNKLVDHARKIAGEAGGAAARAVRENRGQGGTRA